MQHWLAAKQVLRYLSGTLHKGLEYKGTDCKLVGYMVADFAGDISSRKSTSGYVFMLGSGAISWSSKLQKTVAVSTVEAEYIAAASAVKEAIWMRVLLSDLGHNITTVDMRSDSQGAIKLAHNPVVSQRSKHIDVVYHFLREKLNNNDISLLYCQTDYMLADMFTKIVPTKKFQWCCEQIGMM